MTATEKYDAIERLARLQRDSRIAEPENKAISMAIEALRSDALNGVVKPLNKTGYPEDDRDTRDGICPICKGNVWNITPRYRKLTGCKGCGAVIDWRD